MDSKLLAGIRAHPMRGTLFLIGYGIWELTVHDAFSLANDQLAKGGIAPMMILAKLVKLIAQWSVNNPVELFLCFVATLVLWTWIEEQIAARKKQIAVPVQPLTVSLVQGPERIWDARIWGLKTIGFWCHVHVHNPNPVPIDGLDVRLENWLPTPNEPYPGRVTAERARIAESLVASMMPTSSPISQSAPTLSLPDKFPIILKATQGDGKRVIADSDEFFNLFDPWGSSDIPAVKIIGLYESAPFMIRHWRDGDTIKLEPCVVQISVSSSAHPQPKSYQFRLVFIPKTEREVATFKFDPISNAMDESGKSA